MVFVLKISPGERFVTTPGSQTPSVVAGQLIKTFYWLKPMYKPSSLVNAPNNANLCLKGVFLGLGETAQLLRALAVLAENPRLIPSSDVE